MAILEALKIQEREPGSSRFRLAHIVSQRAKLLMKGAKPLVESEYQKPITIALEEVAQDMVSSYDAEEASQIRQELEKREQDREANEAKTIADKEKERAAAKAAKAADESA